MKIDRRSEARKKAAKFLRAMKWIALLILLLAVVGFVLIKMNVVSLDRFMLSGTETMEEGGEGSFPIKGGLYGIIGLAFIYLVLFLNLHEWDKKGGG